MSSQTLMFFVVLYILKLVHQIHASCPNPIVIPLTEPQGVITSKNFPGKFPTPYCNHWVIDSGSEIGKVIRVHLTQVYLIENLTFVEYEKYPFYNTEYSSSEVYSIENDNAVRKSSSFNNKVKRHRETPTPVHNGVHVNKMVRSYATTYRYFAIQVEVYTPYATHFRARNFLNVYGFNMTYEILDINARSNLEFTRNYQCSLRNCSVAGNCFVSEDYRRFFCQCLPGRSGYYCEYSNKCDPGQNITFCHNGGKCRVHASGIGSCVCPPGYRGLFCEIQEDISVKECPGPGCEEVCDETGLAESIRRPCSCHHGKAMPPGYLRYEVTLQSSDHTLPLWEFRFSKLSTINTEIKQLKSKLELEIKEKLVKLSGDKSIYVSVVSFEPASKFSFQFFWPEKSFDTERLKNALTGTTFYVPYKFDTGPHFNLQKYPALVLKNLTKPGPGDKLKVGEDFSITCIAQGSQRLRFKWFKDRIPLDPSLALRVITTLGFTQGNESTSIIMFDSATSSDRGTFTCQVSDMGEEQCKDLTVEIISLPIIEVEPMSLTLQKGDQDQVILCTTENEVPSHNFTYSWLKNGSIVWGERDSNEIIEKLDPYGSLLRIVKAQSTAIYTCVVKNNAGQNSTDIEVKVLESRNSDSCRSELDHFRLSWSRTAAGQIAKGRCPPGYIGFVQRKCELVENSNGRHRAVWRPSDFSRCVSYEIRAMNRSLQNMKMGFANRLQLMHLTQNLAVNLETRVANHRFLYSGEGDRIVSLLMDIGNYMMKRNKAVGSNVNAFLQTYFNATSALLKFHGSCTNEDTIITLSQLIHKLFLPPNNTNSPKFYHSDELIVEIVQMGYMPLRLPLRSESWLSLIVEIPNHEDLRSRNYGSNISFIAYRNLTALASNIILPTTEKSVPLHLISPVVSVIAPPPYQIYYTQHIRYSFNISNYFAEKLISRTVNITCAALNDRPEKGIIWKLDACDFLGLFHNQTIVCDCSNSQTEQIALLVYDITKEEEIVTGGLHWCAILGIVISIIILVGIVLFKISMSISLYKGKHPSISNSSIKLNRSMTNTSTMTARTNLTCTTGISQTTQQLDYSPKQSRSRSNSSFYSSSNYSKNIKPEKGVCLLRESYYVPPSIPPANEDSTDKKKTPLTITVPGNSETLFPGYLDLKTPVSKVGLISYPDVPTSSHELLQLRPYQGNRQVDGPDEPVFGKEHVYQSIGE